MYRSCGTKNAILKFWIIRLRSEKKASNMTNSAKRQEYAALLLEKMQKGDITIEEKQTINDYKRDLTRAVLVRSLPSSFVIYGYYMYKNKGARISVLKSIMCGAGGLLFGLFATPGKKLWETAMEKNHITPQHVLGKITQLQAKTNFLSDEMIDQEIEMLKAQKRSKPGLVLSRSEFENEKSQPDTNFDDSQQPKSSLSFISGGTNEEMSGQSMDEPESLMEKRLRRNRKHRMKHAGDDVNASEENYTNSAGVKVNKYGDPIE